MGIAAPALLIKYYILKKSQGILFRPLNLLESRLLWWPLWPSRGKAL